MASDLGEETFVWGSCSFGRSATSSISLRDDKISRRHALIQMQKRDEYWLVDLGSRSGTQLNGRLIRQASRLRHNGRITVGSFAFTFHQTPLDESSSVSMATSPSLNHGTFSRDSTFGREDVMDCWLLVADIHNSTPLTVSLGRHEFNVLTERWLNECRAIIETNGGTISEFLGDGFFAQWPHGKDTEAALNKALDRLRLLQTRERPEFRLVLHFGTVTRSGLLLNVEHYSGPNVHVVFRLEKLAGELRESRLLSEPAHRKLASVLAGVRFVGEHKLKGFEGTFPCFVF